MHKKLFIAVLALGLLLVGSQTAFALEDDPGDQGAPVKTYGNGQSKTGLSPTYEVSPDPLVTVNAGQNRTVPGTFCNGDWYAPFGFTVGGWYVGNEFYAAYQDPSNPAYWNGTCTNSPSFDVTAINTIIRYSAGPFPLTAMFQPLVFDVASGCNYDGVSNQPSPVGSALCAGPLYAVTWNGAATFGLNLPFPVECCISGDYYASWYSPTAGALRLGCTDGSMDADPAGPTSGTECLIFNDYGFGWDELTGNYFCCFNLTGVVPWGGPVNSLEHIIYSEGYTPDDVGTHCNPGECDYQFWYTCSVTPAENTGPCIGNPGAPIRYLDGNDDWDGGFGMPSAQFGGRTKYGTRFEAIGADTLKAVYFLLADAPFGLPEAPEDLLIEVWAEGGPPSPICGAPTPGALVYSVAIPGNATHYPAMLGVPLPDLVFGTLNGGPEVSFFVTVQVTSGVTVIASGDPETAIGCPPIPYEPHSLVFYPASTQYGNMPIWTYTNERFAVGNAYAEFYVDAYICKEVLPAVEQACTTPADDEWPGFAHDNRQTSASTINVGDPNGVELAWTVGHTVANNFSNPSVANDIVYLSLDDAVVARSLSTGALVGSHSGAPEMASSGNRGNTTIAFVRSLPVGPDRDVVFTTGSTFNAVTAWELNLEGSPLIWSRNPALGNSLGQRIRFNTSKVVDVGGQDVLFVCTEPVSGTGRIWAINANTGALFPGWLTNPLILDAAAKHGPAVSGGKLYVGTAVGGSNVDGSIYQIDAATGTIDWSVTDINEAGEGFPAGVSVEGNFIYAASKTAANTAYRYKIDKSGAMPSVVWSAGQGTGLYGTPTIGRDFVYFPLDNPSSGLLQVDKALGTVARNFALTDDICGTSLFMIPNIVTISCDNYLFAGDRNGHWWLLNAENGQSEWYRSFPGVVFGTALASASDGTDYAVVTAQAGGPGAILSAYQLNSGSRPRLIQCVYDVEILVPLGSGAGQPHSEPDVFLSIGDQPVNFSGYSVADPAPGASSIGREERDAMRRLSDASREFDGYTTIASASTLTKRHRMAGLSPEVIDGGEWTVLDAIRAKSTGTISKSSGLRSLAASAAAVRTSAVTINGSGLPYNLAPGADGDLDWLYDGTGLGRATDVNVLELTNNDPDFNWDAVNNGSISVAEIVITYIGGCPPDDDTLHFNSDGSYETVYNNGALGDDPGSSHEFNFGADGDTPDGDLYDMGLYIIGDSIPGGVVPDFGAEVFNNLYTEDDDYVANVAPGSGNCGFDKFTNLTLGAKRTGGCPGTPVDIHGEMITHSMCDTDFAATLGSPASAIGLVIHQTEVGAYDPLYGDFKLIRWELFNRDAVAKGPIYLGAQADWDINGGTNRGLYSDNFNGWVLWGGSSNTIGYGSLDPNLPSSYSGIDPTFNSPHKLWVMSNPTWVYSNTWDWGDEDKKQLIWSEIVNGPSRRIDPQIGEDVTGQITHKPINLAPNGSAAVHHTIFGVDASSNNPAVIEANSIALAKRAARWAGFARGDVNDDGLVDLADVCWLQGGNYIYPAAYSGDVDADGDNDPNDIARLLSFVSGNAGDRPAGAWRF